MPIQCEHIDVMGPVQCEHDGIMGQCLHDAQEFYVVKLNIRNLDLKSMMAVCKRHSLADNINIHYFDVLTHDEYVISKVMVT